VVSSVFAAIGTTPALMQPRNAVGKSIVSSRHTSTRSSGLTSMPASALANRFTRAASAP